jgi:hypothetical protein
MLVLPYLPAAKKKIIASWWTPSGLIVPHRDVIGLPPNFDLGAPNKRALGHNVIRVFICHSAQVAYGIIKDPLPHQVSFTLDSLLCQ